MEEILPVLNARSRIVNRLNALHERNVEQFLKAYDELGNRNPKWDDAARQAMKMFLEPEACRTQNEEELFREMKAVLDLGCDDPLIRYMASRCEWRLPHTNRGEVEMRYGEAIRALVNSRYPDRRKFTPVLNLMRDTQNYSNNELISLLLRFLPAALKDAADSGQGFEDAEGVYEALRHALPREQAFRAVMDIYSSVRPADDPGPHLLSGIFNIGWAWDIRGMGFAHTVPEKNWPLFHNRIQSAGVSLRKAWDLDNNNARAAAEMLTVLLAGGGSNEEKALWLHRAAAADPDLKQPYETRLYDLYPRWHGSHPEMVAFGQECLAAGNFRGRVAFILIDAHIAIADEMPDRKAYLAQPAVWEGFRSTYSQYLKIFPESKWHLNRYAKFACECQKWDEADALFDQIGETPDMDVFRNKAVYDYYRRKAKRLKAPAPAPVP